MEKILQQILEGQNKISKRLELMEQAMYITNNRLDNIDNQLAENTRFINALSQDVARTATKDSIATLNAKLDILADRSFQQETKLKLIEAK